MFNESNQNQPFYSVKEGIFDNCVNKLFFDHIKKPDKHQQMLGIEITKKYQDKKLSRGYGAIGFENIIRKLSNENVEVVENSLGKLEQELENPLMAHRGLRFGILENLCKIIQETESLKILTLALKVLNLVAVDFQGSQSIAKNEELMKKIFKIMSSQADLLDTCIEVLQTLSQNPSALQCLLNSKYFTDELQNFTLTTSSENFFSVLSNFIAPKPETFAKIEIFKSLINNTSKSNAIKCLALILDCDDCKHHAIEIKIENRLLKILIEACDDETKIYAIMAFRIYSTYKNICIDEFPWKRLLKILILMSALSTRTKINESLQENCIQTLRIMSDDPVVKKYLRKIYIKELIGIIPLTERSREMRIDLLEWLVCKNYKNDSMCEKYSKLFT